jgi:hypothetical protein
MSGALLPTIEMPLTFIASIITKLRVRRAWPSNDVSASKNHNNAFGRGGLCRLEENSTVFTGAFERSTVRLISSKMQQ